MNGTQVLAYADQENLIGDDIKTLERNADGLLNACKDIGLLATNTWKTRYMEVGHLRSMIANEYSIVGINSYEQVKTFTFLSSLITYQNSIHEEIKSRLKAGNSCYYSVQTPLCSRLQNLQIKIYKTIKLPVVLYGCVTVPITSREK